MAAQPRAHALHLWGGGSLTCRCNKDGFHGDGRGWHGDGVIDPQIKHDNEARSPSAPLPSPLSGGLQFPEKRQEQSNLTNAWRTSFSSSCSSAFPSLRLLGSHSPRL